MNLKLCVWIHLGVAERHILFLGHCELALCLSLRTLAKMVDSGLPINFYKSLIY